MNTLSVENAVFRFAGIMVLISLALTTWVHPNFAYFTAFIGLNMFQFSFSGFCPAATVFKKLGLKTNAQLAMQK
ncbi:YgaP family membrane protein [Thalassotalea agarivorans]|uniref:Inner membrane protein YgaP-like transmembrane domain-containing protein n=1 Tax=Thalassotalea agarivorans TaxID=349064 RepID=A0A1I0AVJ7_THASX|nr:DUF2892 domain-containing protein [Thalassotalea agarivorans]SES98398.1 Protein of unknown function [Thalassotalea agarivorans]